MREEGILNLDIYQSTRLKQGESNEAVTASFDTYNERLTDTMTRCRGIIWHEAGDNVVYTFYNTASAIEAALSFENELAEFNQNNNKLCRPITVRIGITPGKVSSTAKDKRGRLPNTDLDVSGHLEKHCPPGKILLSRAAYEVAGAWKQLFRYGPPIRHGSHTLETFVSATNHLNDTIQLRGLSDRQKEVMPLIPFPRWDDIKPDIAFSLTDLQQFFEMDDLLVIFGETRTRGNFDSNVGHPAATSDAVTVMELLCASRTNRNVIAGIDEWEDMQNYVADRNIIVVGSGITNIYAYAFNDLMQPLRFARDLRWTAIARQPEPSAKV